jgi:hypothetical protein
MNSSNIGSVKVQLPNAQGATEVHVTHGGETVVCTPANAMEKAGELIAKHGAGVPSFAYFAPRTPTFQATVKEETPAAPVSVVTLSNVTPIRGSTVSTEGKIRSMIDFAEAEAAGFAPKQSIYERGTMVVDMGVSNAKRSRKDWEAMPLVDDYTNEFEERIAAEERSDESVDAFGLRMTKDGRIGIPGPASDRAKLVTPTAFQGLTTRLGYGGASYLTKCSPELRQFNFNAWGSTLTKEREEKRVEAAVNGGTVDEGHLVLRTRNGAGEREVFGAVTDSYTSFDVDKIAKAFGLALSNMGARGRVTYDGNKARFEAIFHSNVKAEDYVAGEFFKAGIIVRTDDTGGGSIRGNATVWQNLCLNLIIIDRAQQDLFRIRHIGSVEELAKRFRAGIEAGKEKLGYFLKAWGFAVHEDVLAEARKVDADVPVRIEDALPGLFNGIMERELVPVKGRREENVKHLVRMYGEDTSAARRDDYLSRASVVNAFTRFAHEVNSDPWAEDEIQRAAGGLLYGRTDSAKPAPLPWLPLDAKKGGKQASPTFSR